MMMGFVQGPVGRTVQLLAAVLVSAGLAFGGYGVAVDRAVPEHDLPSSYKWLLLEETAAAPRIIIEGGSSGHHGIDTDALSQDLGVTAINIADNAGYDLTDKIARLQRFAKAGDTVVLQLEWSYYLRDSVTDDYLSVLFGALPDYFSTMSLGDKLRRAMTVPAPVLWAAYHQPVVEATVLTPAQQLDIAALQGASGHVSYATARALAAGVEGQSCDAYLFGTALKQGALRPSAEFLAALGRLKALKAQGVQVLFAWPIVAGDDCYTSDIGLPQFQQGVEQAVQAAGFRFLGTMGDTAFPGNLRDDTPYHLITAGAARRTALLATSLRAVGVSGPGALDLRGLTRAVIFGDEVRQPDPAILIALPMEAPLPVSGAAPDQLLFTAGWWQDEASGRWMRGKEAVLTLALDPALPADRALTLTGFTFNGQVRRIGVFFDGQALGQAEVQGEFALAVPTTTVPRGRPVRLTLRVLDDAPLQSPSELGQGEDLRTLSLHLRDVSVAPSGCAYCCRRGCPGGGRPGWAGISDRALGERSAAARSAAQPDLCDCGQRHAVPNAADGGG